MSLGDLSRLLAAWLPGTLPNESLCGWLVRHRGQDCWQCRLIGLFLGREHCWAQFLYESRERRK